MKTLSVLLCLFVVSLSSCIPAAVVREHHLTCSKTKEEVMNAFSVLAMKEGLSPKMSDVNLGFVRLESPPISNAWVGGSNTRVWQLQIDKDGKIMAMAYDTHSSGQTVYFGEDTHKDWGWYWNVRNGIQELCGGTIQMTEKKVN